jgi:hypothetical protein
MTDSSEDAPKPQPATMAAARLALELKRNAAMGLTPGFKTDRKRAERDAAARSAAKSKPMMRK